MQIDVILCKWYGRIYELLSNARLFWMKCEMKHVVDAGPIQFSAKNFEAVKSKIPLQAFHFAIYLAGKRPE